MREVLINLYSDTQTRPTPEMRRAMAEAPCGDEQKGEDPSVNTLCARVADLLGKEDAVFLPSGTMCNEIAILVHCRPGDEIIAEAGAHIIHFEAGGPAAFAGASVRPVPGVRGIYTPAQLHAAVREPSRHSPRSRLAVVEQTANLGGGACWPLAAVQDLTEAARAHGLALHMDGARLLNAAVATGVAARDFAAPFDSVWIDLTKGLGCPVGAVLAGSREFIGEAWRWKHRMGGAMRQAGIIAAAGVYALAHHVERLAEDHDNARHFAARIDGCTGVRILQEPVQTNMVYLDVSGSGRSAAAISEQLEDEHGVRIGAIGTDALRAVTHLNVSTAQVETAASALRAVLEARPR